MEIICFSRLTENVKFEEKLVKVSPSSSEMPVINPSSYKVSGKVTLSAKNVLHYRKISIKSAALHFYTEIEVDPNSGDFHVFLAPAKYQLNVVVTEEENNKGLQYVKFIFY